MVAAITRSGWNHLSCFGHNLNLVVTNATKDDPRVIRAVGVCKKGLQHFSHSWKKEVALLRHKLQKDFLIIPLSQIAQLGGGHNTR